MTIVALDRRLCVAPMMDWTDRHCRYFHRLLAPSALLYTEMVTTGALLRGDAARFLAFDPAEHPVALQLGGSEPADLALSARLGADAGYDEINLNCGCPSDRVQRGRFGACLMREPELVAEAVAAMQAAVRLPVTVKCRIGVDDCDDAAFLHRFVEAVAGAGAAAVVVHARKAWLKGLSPKANRELPPLRYEIVRGLKAAFPRLPVILNGGLREPAAVVATAAGLDGVMIGREAYENPMSLRAFEEAIVGRARGVGRHAAVEAMIAYAARVTATGVPLKAVTRHLLGLMNGLAGARAWRRRLSSLTPADGPEVLGEAAALVRPSGLIAA